MTGIHNAVFGMEKNMVIVDLLEGQRFDMELFVTELNYTSVRSQN